ncbi:MAG: FAD-binding oxidoreductase [Candidatus Acidiferrales bacterium]
MSGKSTKIGRRESLRLLAGGATALLVPKGLPCLSSAAPNSGLIKLQGSLGDKLIAKGSAGYASARETLIWNRRLSDARAPDAIVRATSAGDVQTAIAYANANRLRVTLCGSGHSFHAAALRDSGLLIDVSQLKGIDIDAATRRASVQPGAKGGALAAALERHDLAFPVGHCSGVALSGYLLNGGIGWNAPELGPSCMSVRGIEMITAAGELLYADKDHHADLFWAARGAGSGFFAAVTRYDLELFPKPQSIRTGSITFDYASYDQVATWLNGAMRSVDQRVEVICTLGQVEGSSAVNPKFSVNLTAVAFASSQDEARKRYAALLQPPAQIKPIGDVFDAPSTMTELFQAMDADLPDNKRMSGDSCWTNAQLGDLMMATKPLVPKAPATPSGIFFMALGDAVVPKSDAAAYSVGGRTYVGAYAFSENPKDDQMNRDWVHAAVRAASPYKIGHYVGEADLSVAPERAEQCFSQTAWKRLKSLKRKYDPANVFFSYLTT